MIIKFFSIQIIKIYQEDSVLNFNDKNVFFLSDLI